MVSGRCDIVAFYTPWFMKRYKEGYVDVRNPFYPKLVSRINFSDVDLIMFCTKNPLPIIPYLKEIDKPIVFHVTLTPYLKDIEPNVIDKRLIIDGIKEISKIVGIDNLYVRYIMYLLDGKDKFEAYELIKKIDYSSYSELAISKYDRILKDDISKYSMDDISSTGYVVDTLECALWILLNANTYKETILATTNICNDTDTIGAVAGSMAGIIYGYDNILENWLNKLMRKEYLEELCNKFEELLQFE